MVLSPVKEIAQIGACIGREFSYELIAVVSSVREKELQDALQQLVNSEIARKTAVEYAGWKEAKSRKAAKKLAKQFEELAKELMDYVGTGSSGRANLAANE